MEKVEERIIQGCTWCPFSQENDMFSEYSCNAIPIEKRLLDSDKYRIEQNEQYRAVTPDWCPLKTSSIIFKFKEGAEEPKERKSIKLKLRSDIKDEELKGLDPDVRYLVVETIEEMDFTEPEIEACDENETSYIFPFDGILIQVPKSLFIKP